MKNQQNYIEEKLLANNDVDLGILVADIKSKGRGVRTIKDFVKGEFVVEYAGPLVDMTWRISTPWTPLKGVACTISITRVSSIAWMLLQKAGVMAAC